MIKITSINITVFAVKLSRTKSGLGKLSLDLSALEKSSIQSKNSQCSFKHSLIFNIYFWYYFLLKFIAFDHNFIFYVNFLHLSILSKIWLSFKQLLIKMLLCQALHIDLIELIKSCLIILVFGQVCTARFFVHHFSKKLKLEHKPNC